MAKAIGDERKHAFATAQLATAQWMRGEHVAAAQSARFVLDYAERVESLDATRRAETLPLRIFGRSTLANALHGQGRIAEAIALHREIIGELTRLKLETERLDWAEGEANVRKRVVLAPVEPSQVRYNDGRPIYVYHLRFRPRTGEVAGCDAP